MTSPHVFCTLGEGDYHHGVAALLNSLVRNGFTGVFFIGWRGTSPPWLESLERHSDGGWRVGAVRVRLELLDTPWLLAHVKPHFMLDLLDRLEPTAGTVWYADPDVVVDTSWSFFERWSEQGVALCEDCCFPKLAPHHYLRRAWAVFARERLGLVLDPAMSSGFNSGFIGVSRGDRVLLETWQRALVELPAVGVPLEKLKPGSRLDFFFGTDQDTLNIAALAHPEIVSSLGPEGMGFTPGMSVVWHAADSPKPWRKHYLLDLLINGRGVGNAHRRYWYYACAPVQSWSNRQVWLRRAQMKTAVVLSRFYHAAP
ncbi:MAG TPA: hypothetical protein DIT64_18020 [Verrucomicrobiales bacterium]|nr:hypothetical protein [Verrucomicrobiales bacterium]